MASENKFTDCELEKEVHNQLMTVLCCDYFGEESWKKQFKKFKSKCHVHLNQEARSLSDPLEIWEELEKIGKIGLNNYTVLKKLVKDIDDELTFLIEDAEEKLSSLRGEGKRKRTMKEKERPIQDLQEKLLKHNNDETKRIPVSPLQKTGVMPIEELFAPISIREDLEYQGKGRNIGMQSKRTKPVLKPDDMFLINDSMARNVFMLGEAGIGKSVYCLRLVKLWCKAHDPNVSDKELGPWEQKLKEFDFLFSVPMRHIYKSRTCIIDMICNDVFQNNPECHNTIRRVISDNRYRCLIVIDGLDEWKISDKRKRKLKVKGIPNTEKMANCAFLWSMRPWAMDRFSDMVRGHDRVIEIQELESKSIDIVIEKILVNYYGLDKTSSKYKDMVKEIKGKSHDFELKSVMQVPLVAIACIQIWFEGQDVGNSMTSLYEGLLDLLVRRAKQRSSFPSKIRDKLFAPGVADGRPKLARIAHWSRWFMCSHLCLMFLCSIVFLVPFAFLSVGVCTVFCIVCFGVLLWMLQPGAVGDPLLSSIKEKLGKIAYDGLVSKETHLIFQVDDLNRKLETNELNFALDTGLLSKCEAPGSCNVENISVNFFHKSMQEFLAAIFLSYRYDHEIKKRQGGLYKHLSSVEVIMELGNVLLFLSGLNPMLGSKISQHIVRVANADADICDRYRVFYDVVDYRNKKVELLFKLQSRCFREMKNSRTDGTRKVNFHVSDVYIDDKSDLGTLMATADILTHHYADIRSLMIDTIPTDENKGIPDSILTQFLDQTPSLQALYLDRRNTSRAIEKISDRFSLLTTIILHHVTFTPSAISTLQTVLLSNKVLKSLGLFNIQCPTGLDKGNVHELASKQGLKPAFLSGILHILPDISSLSTFDIQVSNKADKPALCKAIKRLSRLHGIWYHGTHPRDEQFDREIIQTMCTYPGLQMLYLGRLSLGDNGLQISQMDNLATICLFKVEMSPKGWACFTESVIKTERKLDVYLNDLYIDDKIVTKILNERHFLVTRNVTCDLKEDFDFEAVGCGNKDKDVNKCDDNEGSNQVTQPSASPKEDNSHERERNNEVREVSKINKRGAGGRLDLYFTRVWPFTGRR